MTQISMDKKLAMDLIDSKLRDLKNQIENILKKWEQSSADEMIRLSREGR